jgi:hypothetical protein
VLLNDTKLLPGVVAANVGVNLPAVAKKVPWPYLMLLQADTCGNTVAGVVQVIPSKEYAVAVLP